MCTINHLPPERMTPEQRRREVMLVQSAVRSPQSAGRLAESEFELGFSGHQRLHSHPVNNTREEAS